jgi:glycerol kinase
MNNQYILAIDAGTTGITIVVIDYQGQICHREYSEFTQYYPQSGWVEHDADEIWQTTLKLIRLVFARYPAREFAGLGITNQRETTILWDKQTGKPIHKAIVWQCRRTMEYCDQLKSIGYSNIVKNKTGLVIDSYFSGPKIHWLLNNVNGINNNSTHENLMFGTVDTWLIWNLTGGKVHATDHTNASRTMIYNIHELKWDEELLGIMDIPSEILPEVRNSTDNFGQTTAGLFDVSIPINGVAGDQQAALFGQLGVEPGDLKTTYGTGCFLLVNCGKSFVSSSAGLLSTIACDAMGHPVFALEGSVFIGGAVIQWIRDELHLIKNADETASIANSVDDCGDVVIIPSFTGIGAPYWRSDIKGAIFGLHRGTNRNHLIRAALESIAFQVNDLVAAVNDHLSTPVSSMLVDGGAVKNDFLMQFQSDILNISIKRPKQIESTALGAGYLAGLGLGFWSSINELKKNIKIETVFKPEMSSFNRDLNLQKWKKAIDTLLR